MYVYRYTVFAVINTFKCAKCFCVFGSTQGNHEYLTDRTDNYNMKNIIFLSFVTLLQYRNKIKKVSFMIHVNDSSVFKQC